MVVEEQGAVKRSRNMGHRCYGFFLGWFFLGLAQAKKEVG